MHDVMIAKNVMVPMRDGAALATDLYFPSQDGVRAEGSFPVILGRTSYDKESDWLWVEQVGMSFCKQGYVVAIQDLRGRHGSAEAGPYHHVANPLEGEDGYDTVEWLASQEWCDGHIGTVGSSHGGMVQQTLALHRPPHLSAMWVDAAPINCHAHMSREGGAAKLMMFGAQFLHAQDSREAKRDPVVKAAIVADMKNMRSLVRRQPFKRGATALRHVPGLEDTFFQYYTRGEYDSYWAQESLDQERYFDRHADVPAVFSGGWYDPFSMATTSYYCRMRQQNLSVQRLVMGPWTHYGIFHGYSFAGDIEFGPEAKWGFDRYNAERQAWFDWQMKGGPAAALAPVSIFVMGTGDGHATDEGRLFHGGYWRDEEGWPVAGTKHRELYLRPEGKLLEERGEETDSPASFEYDPERPVPTLGGSTTGFFELLDVPDGVEPFFHDRIPLPSLMRSVVLPGGTDQCDPVDGRLSDRSDVLVFQSEPFERDVEVTGVVRARLWVSSSAVDTDITVKLLDVYPPSTTYPAGYDLNLVDTIMRLRYRDGFERAKNLVPGVPYEIPLSLPPTSNVFKVGHRLRIDISSSNFPMYDINPNTGEAVGRHTHVVRAVNSIYMDADHPSHVIVPVIERSA